MHDPPAADVPGGPAAGGRDEAARSTAADVPGGPAAGGRDEAAIGTAADVPGGPAAGGRDEAAIGTAAAMSTAGTRGIVRPTDGFRHFELRRHLPDPGLRTVVDRIWIVHWDRRGQPAYEQQVVTYPAVNLVFEGSGATLRGVQIEEFRKQLEGVGRAIGVLFRSAGFRPFFARPMRTLTGEAADIGTVFGEPGRRLAAEVSAADDDDARARIDRFFLDRLPDRLDPVGLALSDAVDALAADPSVAGPADLADRLGVGVRQLQRLFAGHVGVSPTWVIRRCRLLRALEEAVDGGTEPRWGEIAARLGFADQAHLTRTFSAAVGQPPGRYTRGQR